MGDYYDDYDHEEDYDDDYVQDFMRDEKMFDPSEGLSFPENYEACVKPIVNVWVKHAIVLAGASFGTKVISTLFPGGRHIISAILGLGTLYYFFDRLLLYILAHVLVSFILLRYLMRSNSKRNAHLFTVISVLFLIVGEFSVKATYWQKLRGPLMLIAMKTISLVYDYNSLSLKSLPSFTSYLGYMLTSGSCVFGPWISFKDYWNSFEVTSLSRQLGEKVLEKSLLSLVFLIFSTCWLDWLMPAPWHPWIRLYQRALTIRFSHYFVSYYSEATNLLVGTPIESGIVSPLEVELPYSLMQVVKHWNAPMHRWLKQYVFRVSLEYGAFFSVLTTYLVSASLHGLNFRLAGILVSLGFYSYVEYVFRKKLSVAFNACISAKPCSKFCEKHDHTEREIAVKFFNTLFMLVNIFHLIYLGILLDFNSETQQHNSWDTFREWYELDFISHGVASGMFIFQLFV